VFGVAVSEVTPQTLEEWDAEKRAYRLVDVRSMPEMQRGVLPGAELLPLHLIPRAPGRALPTCTTWSGGSWAGRGPASP
jgi:rhodanese-related sulfurtransferase